MSLTMELRSRRSKSRTPITEVQSTKLENHGSITKTISKTITTKTTFTDANPGEIVYNLDNSEQSSDWENVKNTKYKKSSLTDDYEVTSTNIINQNETNQNLEDSQHSLSSSGSNVSALEMYRAAGDYWNKYPKTDYTYSRHSRDRKEIVPGVIAMPNMSRRSLHSYNSESQEYYASNHKSAATQSFLQDEVDYSKTSSWLTSATKIQPRSLFYNNGQESSYTQTVSKTHTKTSYFKRITESFTSILVTILTCFYFIYKVQNSIFVWLGKKIHKAATYIMLLDTWLLQSTVTRKRKLTPILALCLIPLLLFAGIHVMLASGVSLAPPCHPHCGRIASSYINTVTDFAYDSFDYFRSKT